MRIRFARRLALILGTAASLGALTLGAGALVGACSDDATTGVRVTLKTRAVADDGIDAPFTNAYGWSIQLTKAAVSVGALYYFDGAPIFSAQHAPLRSRDVLDRVLGVRAAHAHPGHYQAGNAMGQMLSAGSFDLALGAADLGTGDGTSGQYRSGRFVFGEKATGAAASALGANVVVLEGKATKGTMTRVFRASGALGDVLDSYGEPKLEGCAFAEEPAVEADGTVTVHVKPSVWLDQSDFETVPESAGGEPADLTPDEEAYKGFVRGLKKGSAVVFSYARN